MNFEQLVQSSFNGMTNVELANKISNLNEKSEQYYLTLTKEQAKSIVLQGTKSLKEHGRIEFGESILTKLLTKFMTSSYITQDIYEQTIEDLTEIFYQFKEDCFDRITDDEAINIMYYFFEKRSGGSLSYLQNKYLYYVSESFKRGCYETDPEKIDNEIFTLEKMQVEKNENK